LKSLYWHEDEGAHHGRNKEHDTSKHKIIYREKENRRINAYKFIRILGRVMKPYS
jgi:hypothetical protein